MDKIAWEALVEASEQRTLTLTFGERNTLAEADEYINRLEKRIQRYKEDIGLCRVALSDVAKILRQRNQPGWEAQLLDTVDGALKATKT